MSCSYFPLPSSSSPAPLLTHQSGQQANFTSSVASLTILHSEGKLPAFLFFPVALHQALPPLCASALCLLLFFPTGDVGRVLCFDVELCPNLAHCRLDKTCQVLSCCSSPPGKTRWPSLALDKMTQWYVHSVPQRYGRVVPGKGLVMLLQCQVLYKLKSPSRELTRSQT